MSTESQEEQHHDLKLIALQLTSITSPAQLRKRDGLDLFPGRKMIGGKSVGVMVS